MNTASTSSADARKAKAKTTEVTLLKDGLTFQGKPRSKGEKISVTDAQIQRLADRGFVAADTKGAK